jgi:hypothetical protein
MDEDELPYMVNVAFRWAFLKHIVGLLGLINMLMVTVSVGGGVLDSIGDRFRNLSLRSVKADCELHSYTTMRQTVCYNHRNTI